jgi:hypothetical protein
MTNLKLWNERVPYYFDKYLQEYVVVNSATEKSIARIKKDGSVTLATDADLNICIENYTNSDFAGTIEYIHKNILGISDILSDYYIYKATRDNLYFFSQEEFDLIGKILEGCLLIDKTEEGKSVGLYIKRGVANLLIKEV